MNSSIVPAVAILLGCVLIALAIFFRPAPRFEAVFGDGYVYVVDLEGKNIANMIRGKTAGR